MEKNQNEFMQLEIRKWSFPGLKVLAEGDTRALSGVMEIFHIYFSVVVTRMSVSQNSSNQTLKICAMYCLLITS